MSATTPPWCPNLGHACGYPDCVYDDAECAAAERPPASDEEPPPAPADEDPPAAPPITAADIDWEWRG